MFWSVSGHRGWCQNGFSIIKAHHHHSHNHRYYDEHNGVDPICDFLLVCAKGPCFLLPSPETTPFTTLQGVARCSIGRSPQQYYGGRSAVRPGRESAFMGQGETFIPALPTIAGTREPRRKLWGGRLPAALRNTQVSQTAAPIHSDVRAGNGIP